MEWISHFQRSIVAHWFEYTSPGVGFPCIFTLLPLFIPNSSLVHRLRSSSSSRLCFVVRVRYAYFGQPYLSST